LGQVQELLDILTWAASFGGFALRADHSLVFLIEFLPDSSHLPAFELGHLDGSPSLGGTDERAKHQLKTALSPKALGMILTGILQMTPELA
jgi:hypothetical protein